MTLDQTRRDLLKTLGAGSAAVSLAGCGGVTGGDSGGGETNVEDIDATTVESWAWDPHSQHLKQMADSYSEDSKHTVEGATKSGMDELWTQGLQSESNIASLTLIRTLVLKNSARQGGMIDVHDQITEYSDGIFDVAKTRMQVDGQWWSYPNDLGPVVLLYNTEVFSEAGLPTEPADVEEELQTWQQYMQAAETIKSEQGADMLAFGPSATNGLVGGTGALPTQAGGGYYNDDGEFEFDQQANVDAYKNLVELNEYGAEISWFSGDFWDGFRNNDLATFPAPGWAFQFFRRTLDSDITNRFRVATLPRFGEDGAFGTNYGGASAGIPFFKSNAEIAVARDFAEFWHFTEEGVAAKLDFGMPPAYGAHEEPFQREVDDFGGQTVWMKVRESAENCPPQYAEPNPDVPSIGEGVLQDVIDGNSDVEDALSSRQEEMEGTLSEEGESVPV